MAHAITLQLPNSLYDHFKRRAQQARRTLEAELLDALRVVASDAQGKLPGELEADGYSGVLDSREHTPGGARMSERSGEKFTAMLAEERRRKQA